MGILIKIIIVITALGMLTFFHRYQPMSRPIPPPKLDFNTYWGPGSEGSFKDDTAIKAFDIAADREVIDDLKAQLKRPLKLHEPLEGVGFEYGFNSNELEKVVRYWRDIYLQRWSEREMFLKQFPHFKTQIQGLNIHFIHVKPKKTGGKKIIPLLLLHGWPGSVREFYDFIPLLTTPDGKSNFIFEVVAPSLPGYGWSQATSKTGLGPTHMSIVLRNLMLRLGFDKFLVQGGDFGSVIGAHVATLFPQNVLAYHSNMCFSNHPLSRIFDVISLLYPRIFLPSEHREFYKPFDKHFSDLLEETGYMHIQATKPDTIGTALSHNPVGLAAYILEKFSAWTNVENRKLADGGITKHYTMDSLLDNVMIYYITNSITTSQRLYAEFFNKAEMALKIDRVQVKVPTACARFLHDDLMHTTDGALKHRFPNIIQSTYHPVGGHFAAMEVPDLLYEDFYRFVNKAFKYNITRIENNREL